MAPKTLDFSEEFSKNYVPEDKDQAIVKTPFGKGIVIRTRKDDKIDDDTNNTKSAFIREIELVDWTKLESEAINDQNNVSSSTSSSSSFSFKANKPHMLYTPTDFPSVTPTVNDDVLTQFGRGKVVEIRNDDRATHVVKLSSWRLAGRASIFCYLTSKECKVMRPYRIYDMDVFEKVEHANDLKKDATLKFVAKNYDGALEIYARAVDTVRYVQHGKDSTNELRADLIVVMITCSNNASLCSSKKKDWERTEKFAANALVLIEALGDKKETSKIRKILNNDGIRDSQLFGTWKVKSLILVAKAQMERHKSSQSIKTLKRALETISLYKREVDNMYKQFSSQEKDIRRIRSECSQKMKSARKKEKERAKAMFGVFEEEKKDSEKEETIEKQTSVSSHPFPIHPSSPETTKTRNPTSDVPPADRDGSIELKVENRQSLKKKVTYVDGTVPGGVIDDDDGDNDHSQSSFFDEHFEALFIGTGIVFGWLLVNIAWRKR